MSNLKEAIKTKLSSVKLGEGTAFFLLLLFYFVFRCSYLDVIPKFDAGIYWDGVKNAVTSTQSIARWTELPKVVIENYNYLGHTSMGYFSLLVLGQLIDFPSLFMLNLTNLLLAIFSIFCVFKIFRYFLPDQQQIPEVIIATFIYALDPLFIASSIFLNTDFPVLVFYTSALTCLLYGYYGWFAVSCLFMVFSKETGSLYWLSLVGGALLFRPLKFSTDLRRIVGLFVPGVVVAVYAIVRKGKLWEPHQGAFFDSNGWNCFGFNPRVVFYRFGEMFVLNFHWILGAFIVLVLVVSLIRLVKKGSLRPQDLGRNIFAKQVFRVLPVVLSFLAFVLFNLSYITFVIPRYVVQSGFFLILFSILLMPLVFRSSKTRIAILTLTLVLFGIQSLSNFDPLSKLYFGTATFGSHKILFIDTPGESVGNGFAYNTEFTKVDKLINLMQSQIPMQPETTLIAWNSNEYLTWLSRDSMFVDSVSLKRTVDWRNAFRYRVIDVLKLPVDSMPEAAVYVYMPWLASFSNEEAELTLLKQFYTIQPPTEVDIRGYNLRFYRLSPLKK